MRNCKLFFIIAIGFYAIISWITALADTNDEDRIYEVVPYGYIDAAAVWPSFQISVCWRETYPSWEADKRLAQEAVQALIQSNSSYRFIGWSLCPSEQAARIDIYINLERPASAVGRQRVVNFFNRQDVPTVMHLNFSNYCPFEVRENCIKIVAVHEFLHAIGFLHEYLRDEVKVQNPHCVENLKEEMRQDFAGTVPTKLTEYDPDSIMNYCAYPQRYWHPPYPIPG